MYKSAVCSPVIVLLQASLLVGGAGTAKTSIINLFLSRFNPEEASSKTITFSYLTTPQIFQMSVEVSLFACIRTSSLICKLSYAITILHSIRLHHGKLQIKRVQNVDLQPNEALQGTAVCMWTIRIV